MVKVFCDMCGKDVTDFKEKSYRITIVVDGRRYNRSENEFELCSTCELKFNDMLRQYLNKRG